MENFDRKAHWEALYGSKELKEVSWYQPVPITSLIQIAQTGVSKNGKIIDVGGGDSLLVDHLISKDYKDITVLDISAQALNRAQKRLGEQARLVKWIEADASEFVPTEVYDVWHDRAAFHFLTQEEEIKRYVEAAGKGLKSGGTLIVATFSEKGPKKCSGVDIKQYTPETLNERFKESFELQSSFEIDHTTPFNTLQNFLFAVFKKV